MSAGDPVVQGAVNDAVDATTTLTAKFSGTTLVVNNTMGSSGSHVGAIEATVAWGNGIVGMSTEGNGITGHGPNGNGVVGTTNVGFGVLGSADTPGGVGVVANSATGTGPVPPLRRGASACRPQPRHRHRPRHLSVHVGLGDLSGGCRCRRPGRGTPPGRGRA